MKALLTYTKQSGVVGVDSCFAQKGPRSVFGSSGVVLMSCKVNFHVVRSALQNSVSVKRDHY